MNLDDLNTHIRNQQHKNKDKDKEIELKPQQLNESTNHLLEEPNSENRVDSFRPKVNTPCNNANNEVSCAEQVLQSIATGDVTTQMVERCSRSHHVVIVKLLTSYLKALDADLQLMPFGSTTYGFAESTSDFNILIQTGII